jgi:hypothetical protein
MKMDDYIAIDESDNRAHNCDNIAQSSDFLSVFFEKVVIHNDFGKINIS